MNHLQKHGKELVGKGYEIVPIVHKKKCPGEKEWQKIKATPALVDEWVENGYTGVGILCKKTPSVDLDIRDKEFCKKMAKCVAEIAGQGPLRVGMAPKALIPFKTLKPFGKMASKKFVDLTDPYELDAKGDPKLRLFKGAMVPVHKTHQVEILGDGAQFVAYGIHPDTDKPYKWSKELYNTKWDDLPTLGKVQAKEIIDIFEQECHSKGWIKDSPTLKPDQEGGVHVRGQITASFPNLDLPDPHAVFSEVEESGIGNDAALPYLPFQDVEGQSIDPGRLQLEDCVVKKALGDVDPGEMDYDEWLKVGMALWHQFNGNETGYGLWETWSERSDRHDVTEMKRKWESFSPEPGKTPVTFRTVLKLAEKARKAKNIEQEYLSRYVYVESADTVHDLYGPPHKPSPILKNFKVRTAPDTIEIMVDAPLKDDPDRKLPKDIPMVNWWLKNPDRKWVSGETYYPTDGQGSRIIELQGYQYVNTFRMPPFPKPTGGSVEVEGLIKPFLEHMTYLFPKKEEREWFLSWMALNIQHPDRRCKVTPLHISLHHGTGRGWLVQLLGKLLGPWNCTKAKMQDIVGDKGKGAWGDYLDKSLLCCVEETHDGGNPYGVEESIRDILTEDTLQLNLKYGGISTQRVFTNFFFMSNRADALILKAEDRRINVFKLIEPPRDREYYMKLYQWSKGRGEATGDEIPTPGVSALWHWLSERSLEGFNWQESLKSDSRKELIQSGQNKVETYFFEIMDSFPYKVITVKKIKEIMAVLAENDGEDPWGFEGPKVEKQIAKMLQQKGAVGGNLVKIKGKSYRFWKVKTVTVDFEKELKNEILEMEKWKFETC